ncbi:MAG TPA: undecaprenyldiphospho-muramoylpentapeptide beta-N-acetylglucosaminyltransferase [Thermomicrobiales bacterium]|nr:undecaprenyldiphospho-muramoylpentapeptide beta-N-acetylglucosaminyltransferase [Thermomicrobiales bacterium]
MPSESTTGHSDDALRLVVAGGGTGGHISPAVAVVQELQRRRPVDVLWLGSGSRFERDAAAGVGAAYRAIQTGKLRRYLSLQTPIDAARIPLGVAQAWSVLGRWRPDVVLATGGFVSVPTVVAARARRIPTLTHEQTAHIGLATKINARFADVVALSFERSRALVGASRGRVVVTGNPVRPAVLCGSRDKALRRFELSGTLPLVYITGGAQGAHVINQVVGAALSSLLGYVESIHQCGPSSAHHDYGRLRELAAHLPKELRSRYRVVEMVGDELGDVYAAASLVVGRAGAGTVNELGTLGIPSILVPLPGAEEQQQNALQLVEAGGAIVIPQDDLTPERLIQEVRTLIESPTRLTKMAGAARNQTRGDAAARIADELELLASSQAD